jgi:hypothetical protein
MIIPRKSRQQLHGVETCPKFTPIDRRLIMRQNKDRILRFLSEEEEELG